MEQPTPTEQRTSSSRASTHVPPSANAGERSLGDLFRKLADETRQLLRQEMALARGEIRETLGQMGKAVRQISIGGALAMVGGLALIAFAITALGALLDNYWLAALIVALVLLGGGGFLIWRGISGISGAELAPRQTLSSLQTTSEWATAEAADVKATLTSSTDASLPTRHQQSLLAPDPPAAPPPVAERERRAPAIVPASSSSGSETARHGGEAGAGSGGAQPGDGLLKRVAKEFMDDDIMGEAAKVAYYAFLALPPALLVIFSLTGFFGGPAEAEWIASRLQAALPESASELVDEFVTQIVHDNAPGPFSIGLVLALWAASNIFMSLGKSLNAAYDVEEERGWVKQRAIAVVVMLAAVALMIVASVALIAGPGIASALNLWGAAEVAWNILQWPLAFLFVGMAFFLVYYALPTRDQSASKSLLFKASMVAGALWLVASFGFRIYISNFASYSETYGFLGAVIVLLLWLYVTGVVVLLGGELASEMEKGHASD